VGGREDGGEGQWWGDGWAMVVGAMVGGGGG
jgi:hypothetical protein